MKAVIIIEYQIKLEDFKEIIIGNKIVISTSKTKNKIAIKKKCKEKGNRPKILGSNPHSKGELFSRSLKDFFEIKFKIKIKRTIIKKIKQNIKFKILIIYANSQIY